MINPKKTSLVKLRSALAKEKRKFLDKSKKIKMRWYKLFAALGIDGCGRSLSKILEREYPMKGKSIFSSNV